MNACVYTFVGGTCVRLREEIITKIRKLIVQDTLFWQGEEIELVFLKKTA